METNFIYQVWKITKKIPKGKVVTYGQIASLISTKFVPRLVGFVLHQNKDPNVPCHRVVNRAGKIAQNYVYGGLSEQKKKLESENVKFRDKMHVDLKKYQWSKF